jgi:GEVED domain/Putative metal-binding motif/Secretion system C-terminal sorting domain
MTNYYNSLGRRMDTIPKNSKIATRCWQLCLTVMLLFFSFQSSNAQVVFSQDFNLNATGWTGTILRTTATTACGSASMRRNMYSGAITGTLISPLTGTTLGGAITLGYSYKVANWSANTVGTPNPWGSFNVQYGASATGPWTTVETIDASNHIVSGTCATKSVTFTPPAGALFIKWDAVWTSGDYYINFDNIVISEAASSACAGSPAPGNTLSTVASACSGVSFNLTLQTATPGSGVTFQWQSADDAAFTSGVTALGTAAAQTTSQTSAKYYRCAVTCAGNTTISTPVAVALNSFIDCYCSIGLTTTGGASDTIASVTFGGYTSGAIGGVTPWYTAVANTPVVLTQGTSVPLAITMGTDGNQDSGVWIDFDHSGTFDASENLALSTVSAGASAVVNYTLNLPPTGLLGLTKMRIRGAGDDFYTAAGACIGQSYGETEDYLVDIVANAACAGVPAPGATLSSVATTCAGVPFSLSLSTATLGSGVTYQWESADDAGFTTGVTALGTTGTQAIASQSSAKYYRCTVTCATGPDTTVSTPVLVAQSPGIDCYCTPIYTSGKTLGDLISNISITGTSLANNSGTAQTNPAYTFFTGAPNLTGDLQAGSTYAVNVTVGTWGNQHIKAWVDYNDNGLFETSETIGAAVIAAGQGNTGPFPAASFSITLSCNPPLGVHRLRVRSVWSTTVGFFNTVDPCDSQGFGETEDYLINITTADPCPTPSALTATIPTSSGATLGWTIGCAETAWEVAVQSVGAGVPTSGVPATSTSFPATGLASGTSYEFYVRAECTAGTLFSSWAGPFIFTTLSNAPGCATPVSPANAATGVVLTAGAADITWTAPAVTPTEDAAASYDVFFGTTSGTLTNIGNLPAPGVTANITGLLYNTTYYWRIAPVNTGGTNVTCAEFSFTTEVDPCSVVNNPGDTFATSVDLGILTSAGATATASTAAASCFKDDYTTTSTPGDALARPGRDVFYKFEVVDACNSINIGTCATTALDTYVHILDNTGTRINGADGGCPGGGLTPASVALTNLAPGIYYAVVEGWVATTEGAFTLSVSYTGGGPIVNYYTDADNDGYGDTNAVAQASCSPVAGKVTDNTDCNDTNAAVNPDATDVPYDGLDNNCNGTIDEGAAPIITQLVSSACNSVLSAIETTVYVDAVVGATNYRFRVINGSTTQLYETTNRYMKLTNLASYLYGTTYTIDVEVQRAGVWLGYYGTTCTVTTPSIPVLAGTSCASTIVNQFTGIYTTNLPGVSSYKFRVTNLSTGVAVETTNVYNWFNFNMLSVFVYGKTYAVEVAVKTTGTTFSDYSTPCNVSTPAVPGLSPSSCGATIPTLYTGIYTTNLSLATSYRFELTKVSTGTISIVDRSVNWFNFSLVPGYVAGDEYEVRLQVLSKGVYSDFGPSCTLNPSAGSAARFGDATASSATGTEFKAVGYPNPFETNFTLNVTTTSDEKVQVAVYDMIGKQLESKEVNATDANALEVGANYPAGVYNVVVSQGVNVKSLRMIKR